MSRDSASPSEKAAHRKRKRKDKTPHENSKKRRVDPTELTTAGATDLTQDERPTIPNGISYSSPEHSRRHAKPRSRQSSAANQTRPKSRRSESPFYLRTTSFYLPLSPISQRQPLEGLCAEHLSPLLLTYYEPLKGILLSYSNARLSNHPRQYSNPEQQVLSEAIDEYAVTYTWVTADFLILRPERGAKVEGHISVQSQSHIGLICWNLFNVSIPYDNLPDTWEWVGEPTKRRKIEDDNDYSTNPTASGHFVDGDGNELAGLLKFRVVDYESLSTFGKDKSFISIRGTLVPDKEHNDGQTAG